MEERLPKFKIYKDIICLEVSSFDGAKYWDQGFGLGYTAAPVHTITKVRYGLVAGTTRRILAGFHNNQWIAINLPRSDIFALKARGLLPTNIPLPYDKVVYTNLPASLSLR